MKYIKYFVLNMKMPELRTLKKRKILIKGKQKFEDQNYFYSKIKIIT